MKFAIFTLLAVVIFGLVRTHFGVRRSTTEEERAVNIRFSALAWLGLLVFVAILLLPVPNKQRIMLLVPVVLIAIGFAKFWRDKRARLRREDEERHRLDRMKRVN